MKLSKEQEAEQIYSLFDEFKNAYTAEWERLDRCERLYRGEHWYDIPTEDANEPRPVTPILHSTVENMRSDLMDNFPEAVITSDRVEYDELAKTLSTLIKENHTECRYMKEFGELTHDLTVGGYMIQETGYDETLNHSLGGTFIRHVDPRNIMFDPCCTDIQDSRAVFKFTPYTKEWFYNHYPNEAGEMKSDRFRVGRLRDDVLNADTNDNILLIECWKREYNPQTGMYSIHMLKLAGGILLEDSRELKPQGYFSHGEYPFTVTPLFARKGSCLGYGIIDMFKSAQLYSDKLDQIVMKNALMASHNKLLVTGASGFDIDDLRDWSKEVHRGENLNGVTWFPTSPLPSYIIDFANSIRTSIKEESGCNDFSRGMTMGGVTAASAIAALQEMSSKRSRLAIKAVHEAFREAVNQEIEVEREFSVFSRQITIEDENGRRQVSLSPDMFFVNTELGNKIPLEFKVSVKVQRANSFSVAAHNDLILQLASMGIITGDVALELLMFDSKAQALALMRKKTNQTHELNKANTQTLNA
ncbi:MAG: hypothetical protein IJF80_03635 [Clostridia bacterium]|nr:hypothetical protein [Clostridia bacterium]